jgi:hypothetical protein
MEFAGRDWFSRPKEKDHTSHGQAGYDQCWDNNPGVGRNNMQQQQQNYQSSPRQNQEVAGKKRTGHT